ncbi:glycosyltransferase [Aliarcobacter butzleri]|uniref:glycosyltransferase n=1 Tax=Aliarcobacter butzleri TaxID=28197 RepID=UPI002B24E26A|nr:glycosyltransferase [Aliarcobacter butzleri]
MKNKITILGIDNFSKKNIGQLDCILKNGYELDIFTNNVLSDSILNTQNKANVYILEESFFNRYKQIYKYLKLNSETIHHSEIYPGGRFAFVYIFLCRVFKIKTIAVERGDLLYYSKYDKLTQFSMRTVYKNSDIVWYRESYKNFDTKKELLKFKSKQILFIHNSIDIKKVRINYKNKTDLFLWVNSIKSFRYPEWFVNNLNDIKFANTTNILLGLKRNTKDIFEKNKQEYIMNNKTSNLQVFEFIEPNEYYLKSKFFVLTADVVFLNNSLLEAMSYGLIPLISDVQDARLIVDDGINGFIFEHTENGLKNAMQKAMLLSQEEYEIMSKNAIKKVEKSFSYDVWCEKYINMIKSLNNV